MSIGIAIVTRITDDYEIKALHDPLFAQPEDFLAKPFGSITVNCVFVAPRGYHNDSRVLSRVAGKNKTHSFAGHRLPELEDPVNLGPGSQSLPPSKAFSHLRRRALSGPSPVVCSERADHPWSSCAHENRTFGSSCACWVDRSASYISLLYES